MSHSDDKASAADNLSEKLFANNKQAKETSNLTRYMPSSEAFLAKQPTMKHSLWYRQLRRLQWCFQGIDPIEMEEVFAKMASSTHARTTERQLDTVIGYHSGNWAFEWSQLAGVYQQKASRYQALQDKAQEVETDAFAHGDHKADGIDSEKYRELAANALFNASFCYSLASYPHLTGDTLAVQSQLLARTTYSAACRQSKYIVKPIEFIHNNRQVTAHLHLTHTNFPQAVVIVCGGLDSLQTDMWQLFLRYFTSRDIGMLTFDMPSVGYSNKLILSENSSDLVQSLLTHLKNVPYVDHFNVGLLGFRFGGNMMARLAFIEPDKIKACVCIGAPVHSLFVSPEKIKQLPKMHLDVLASRLGKNPLDIDGLAVHLSAFSLKNQGFLQSRKTSVPILALSLADDPFSSPQDNKLLAMFSHSGQAKTLSSKQLSSGYDQVLDLAIKWLESRLIK